MGVRESTMMRRAESDAADPAPSAASAARAARALYVDDPPSEEHDYLFSFDDPEATADAADATAARTVWRDDVEVDEERSPLVAAVVCAAHLAGVTPMLAADDSSDEEEEEEERELDASCSLAQCAGLLDVPLARVYPPTAQSVARAIAHGTPVLVVHAGAPCVLHTVADGGSLVAARFDTCVGTAVSFTPKDVRYMFGFWSPVAAE